MLKQLISVVVPIHNEAPNIPMLYQELNTHTRTLPYRFEFIFVDDGSNDESTELIQKLSRKDRRVQLIEFARNFGKEAAVSAGLHSAQGSAAVILDADLQHPPSLINKFLAAWRQGADVVVGVKRYSRYEGRFKRWSSDMFYRLLGMVSHTNITPHASDYRLIDKKVIKAFCEMTEHNRITRGIIDWLGFRRRYIHFEAPPRQAGTASYGYRQLFRLAFNSLTAYSLLPLKLAGYLGGFILATAAPLGIFLLVMMYPLQDPWGWNITGTALLAVLILILIGLVLACLGLVAMYIAHIHAEVTNRPLYVVRKQDEAVMVPSGAVESAIQEGSA
jgi:glycosyltransferase involved in cell wall biosynthesis